MWAKSSRLHDAQAKSMREMSALTLAEQMLYGASTFSTELLGLSGPSPSRGTMQTRAAPLYKSSRNARKQQDGVHLVGQKGSGEL